jgi:hypothetical protein
VFSDVRLLVGVLLGIRDSTESLAKGAVEADLDMPGRYLRRLDSRREETLCFDGVDVDVLNDLSDSTSPALTAATLTAALAAALAAAGVVEQS